MLDINKLSREGAIQAGASGVYSWHDKQTNAVAASVKFSMHKIGNEDCLKISFYFNDSSERTCWISLQETYPHFGGKRFWFTCDCGKRVGRLHLVEGVLACRICHDLSYKSCQENHQVERFLEQAAKLGGNRNFGLFELMFERINQYVKSNS